MRRLVLSLLVAFMVASPTAAQVATPEPHVPYPGEVAYASRVFDASGMRLVGIIRLSFSAIEFESENAARDGMVESYERWLASASEDGNVVTMQEASAPSIRDETLAMAGTITTSDGIEISVATLQVRIDRFVLGMVGGGFVADALPELVRIADLVVPRGEASGELADWLPVLADMPTGFVLAEEVLS